MTLVRGTALKLTAIATQAAHAHRVPIRPWNAWKQATRQPVVNTNQKR